MVALMVLALTAGLATAAFTLARIRTRVGSILTQTDLVS